MPQVLTTRVRRQALSVADDPGLNLAAVPHVGIGFGLSSRESDRSGASNSHEKAAGCPGGRCFRIEVLLISVVWRIEVLTQSHVLRIEVLMICAQSTYGQIRVVPLYALGALPLV